MIGYAARLRLLRSLVREGHEPASVGAAGRGAAVVVFEGGTRVMFTPETVEIIPSEGIAADEVALGFAMRLADLSDIPLAGGDPGVGTPDQTTRLG